jgi:hypothetical protein
MSSVGNNTKEDDTAFPTAAVGRARFQSDRRQLGGIMLLLATCATIQPLAGITGFFSLDNLEESTLLQQVAVAGGVCQLIFGLLGMVVGYLSLVHDYGNPKLSGVLILLTQTAYVPFVTELTAVGQVATAPYEYGSVETITQDGNELLLEEYVINPFLPADYLPTEQDVRFFGAMGILGILAYGMAFFGSLGFTKFALYAFDKNKPNARNADYYRSRLLCYTFLLVLAGMSQLLLGAYTITEYGTGPLEPPMRVAMYVISFPEISIVVGSIQMLVGYYGIARYLAYVPVGPKDHQYQLLLLFQWICMVALQYLTQITYSNDPSAGAGNNAAASVPSLALLSVGLNVLPAFLDYKMRTIPTHISKEYYGILMPSTEIFQDGIGAHRGGLAAGEVDDPELQSVDSSNVHSNADTDAAIVALLNGGGTTNADEEESESGWEDTVDTSEGRPEDPPENEEEGESSDNEGYVELQDADEQLADFDKRVPLQQGPPSDPQPAQRDIVWEGSERLEQSMADTLDRQSQKSDRTQPRTNVSSLDNDYYDDDDDGDQDTQTTGEASQATPNLRNASGIINRSQWEHPADPPPQTIDLAFVDESKLASLFVDQSENDDDDDNLQDLGQINPQTTGPVISYNANLFGTPPPSNDNDNAAAAATAAPVTFFGSTTQPPRPQPNFGSNDKQAVARVTPPPTNKSRLPHVSSIDNPHQGSGYDSEDYAASDDTPSVNTVDLEDKLTDIERDFYTDTMYAFDKLADDLF